MTFTDNDLKQLKETLSKFGIDPGIDVCNYFEASDEIAALLSRLEAAENVVTASQALKSAEQIMYGNSTILREYNEALEAWRKAAGND